VFGLKRRYLILFFMYVECWHLAMYTFLIFIKQASASKVTFLASSLSGRILFFYQFQYKVHGIIQLTISKERFCFNMEKTQEFIPLKLFYSKRILFIVVFDRLNRINFERCLLNVVPTTKYKF